MIRDEDGALTGYVYLDLKTKDYGGFVDQADKLLRSKLELPAGYTYRWAGEYEFELHAKERLKIILPVVFFVIFLLLYMVFKSAAEAAVLIFPTLYAMSGGLILQWVLGYNFSVAVWVGYIALFGIAVETGVVMVVYLHEALQHRLATGYASDRRRCGEGYDRGRSTAATSQADDRHRRDSESCADLVGVGHRVGCYETDRRSYRGRHDYIDYPCPDSGPRLLLLNEATCVAAWHAR